MVSQLGRPNKVGNTAHIFWFGVDDTTFTVYTPIYPNITGVPSKWSNESGDIMTFSLDSAFWVFNMLSNFAYIRYSVIHPEVVQKIIEYQNYFFSEVEMIDQKYAELYNKNPDEALELLTTYCLTTADNLVSNWLEYWKYLFARHLDGNLKIGNPPHKFPNVTHPGYPQEWYDRVVKETGDHYKMIGEKISFNPYNPPKKYGYLY